MKILLVGDFSSIHIYNYVKNVIAKVECECVGYHYVSSLISDDFYNLYTSLNLRIIYGINSEVYRQSGAVKFTLQSYSKLIELGNFDYIHLHSVRIFICPAIYLARKCYNNIILTYWGSDLYRNNKLKLIKTLPTLHIANIITMVSSDMAEYFGKLPWFLSRYKNKIKIMDFGNLFYEKILEYSFKNSVKEEFGLDRDKLVCTIGYVGRPQMQQIKTLDSIKRTIRANKDKIQLVIPAYGITNEDYNQIERILKGLNVKYIICDGFMNAETVSKLRVMTDIFIHAQTTDALSNSMLEHLYAGSVVINGGWLKYSSLVETGIYYRQFSDFNNLDIVLADVLKNFDKEANLCKENRHKIAKISSWDFLRSKWINLYK